jgi:hypothetical protein
MSHLIGHQVLHFKLETAKLFCRIITVGLETMKIVQNLPALEIKE